MEELLKRLDELETWKKNLESSADIPSNVEQAFKGRFSLPQTSTKSATSENQAVNEAGIAAYSVLGIPDAYIQIELSNTIYYIPVFT